MLRRPPTAIILTSEDIIRYEEARQQKLAQKAREESVESAKPATKSKRAKDTDEKAQRSASDRIMGTANSGASR
jgi:hypothetical protein